MNDVLVYLLGCTLSSCYHKVITLQALNKQDSEHNEDEGMDRENRKNHISPKGIPAPIGEC
jgi:hypothetical protein